jgi:AcrR family transcriptional regulator
MGRKPSSSASTDPTPAPIRRLPRAERREQTLDAATRAFARAGFDSTGLDDVAAEAGISRVLLYRLFESKTDLYRAVLDRACARLTETVGADDFTDDSVPALLRAASQDPDGFRLLFRYASREPQFRQYTDNLATASTEAAHKHLAAMIPDPRWAVWAANLIPTATTEAVIAWLDAGEPDPDKAADRVAAAVHGIIAAAQSTER